MKNLLFLFCLLIPIASFAQHEPPMDDWDVIRDTRWMVTVAGDTMSDRYNRYDTVVKGAATYAQSFALHESKPEIKIIGATYRFEYSFNYSYSLEPDTVKVPVYEKPEPVRKFTPIIDRPNPDTTETYTLIINGESDANSISIAYTCYDERGRHNGGGPAEQVSDLWTWERELDCNTILTYWVTAQTDSANYVGVNFIDVAHQRAIGN